MSSTNRTYHTIHFIPLVDLNYPLKWLLSIKISQGFAHYTVTRYAKLILTFQKLPSQRAKWKQIRNKFSLHLLSFHLKSNSKCMDCQLFVLITPVLDFSSPRDCHHKMDR